MRVGIWGMDLALTLGFAVSIWCFEESIWCFGPIFIYVEVNFGNEGINLVFGCMCLVLRIVLLEFGIGPEMVHFGPKITKHGRLVNVPKWPNVYKPAMFGHFWSKWIIFGPSPVMNGGPQRKKSSSPGLLCVACLKNLKVHVWNINVAAIYEKCQK